MKKSLLHIFLFFGIFCTSQLYSQAPDWSWLRDETAGGTEYVNDVAYSSFTDSVYVCGFLNTSLTPLLSWPQGNSIGSGDAFFTKLFKNSPGGVGPVRVVGSNGIVEEALAIAVDDSNGDIYITGRYNGLTDFNPAAGINTRGTLGGQDAFLAKYNRYGVYIWAVNIGGGSTDGGQELFVDASGVYVTGLVSGMATGITFSTTGLPATAIVKASASTGTDFYIAKYTTGGVPVWASISTGAGSSADGGYGITADGTNVYAIGDYASLALAVIDAGNVNFANLPISGSSDIAVIALNKTTGAGVWANRISSTGADIGRGIISDGTDIYITGGVNTNVSFISTGPSTFTTVTTSSQDMFVAKLNNAGVFQWVDRETGNGTTEYGKSLALVSGKLFVTGPFNSTAALPLLTLVTAGGTDVFLASYLTNGQFIYSTKAGGLNADQGTGVAVDNNADAYVGGDHRGGAGGAVFTPFATGLGTTRNCYVAKCGCGLNLTIPTAGSDQTVCATTANLAGNIISIGAGTWSLQSGAGVITTPGSPNSGITGLGVGVNTFVWTNASVGCTSLSDAVLITRHNFPTTSVAGINQTVCATTSNMTGNVPAVGNGTWSLVSGAGTITLPNLATTGITALGVGVNVFQWSIGNLSCPNSTSTMSIQRDQPPTSSVAGSNQTVCATTANMAGNTPAIGTGTWSLISGAGTITSPNSPITGITALGVGVNVFQWTIGNGICASSSTTMSIKRDDFPTTSIAGPSQTVCATTATLAANTPVVGAGAWNVFSGPGFVSAPSLPNSGVVSLGLGSNVFEWVISNGVCPISTSTVEIYQDTNPTASNAGPSQSICAITNATMAGNVPAIGTGTWTLVSGSGLITSPNSPISGITSIGIGTNVFQWAIGNGVCPVSTSTMAITRFIPPSASIAGANQTVCATVATMNGNTPAIGTGSWTLISGAGTIT
ncbi:MAG: hypothetical protein SGJ15_00610, partial [Bacteroidota bacterium]|nr:hypothetical protein [Bacteroidota bacterium]